VQFNVEGKYSSSSAENVSGVKCSIATLKHPEIPVIRVTQNVTKEQSSYRQKSYVGRNVVVVGAPPLQSYDLQRGKKDGRCNLINTVKECSVYYKTESSHASILLNSHCIIN
jgi:hypothetical protein